MITKRLASLFVMAAIVLVFGAGCDELVTDLTTPNVEYAAISGGNHLRLTWAPVTDAEGYKVEIDGTVHSTTATTYDITAPAKDISVLAYKGSSESRKWSKSLAPVMTTSLDVWGRSDPSADHPSGFGFSAGGTAIAYAVGDPTNHPNLEFVMEDIGMPMHFYSPNRFSPPFNSKDNGIAVVTGSFDNADIATGDFFTAHTCIQGGVYYFWLDPDGAGWDPNNDHFGKIQVLSIQDKKVTLRLAYQTVPGLRWVKTN